MVRKRLAVLVVDDEETICDLVSEKLAEEGYACDVASTADSALAKLKEHTFDVVLLDIKLPGKSGMDILKTVKRRYPMTAIIMITGVNDLGTAVEAMKLGASDYIVKPFTFGKLNTSINDVLGNSERRRTVDDTVPRTADAGYGKTAHRALGKIDAIANGIDAQVDHFDFHSKIVTEKTVEVAEWLGLPQEEIEKWAVARYEFHSERDRRIRSALSKLERNAMAQVVLGLTRPVYHLPEPTEQQN